MIHQSGDDTSVTDTSWPPQ